MVIILTNLSNLFEFKIRKFVATLSLMPSLIHWKLKIIRQAGVFA
jgi:hypothetical protein